MPDLVETVIEDDRWQDLDIPDMAEATCGQTLGHLGIRPAGFEISLLACDDARIARLNADFRDRPQPTNVLSWPALDLSAQPGERPLPPPQPALAGMVQELGDIAIAYDTSRREALEQGKRMADHVTHLLVHGCLHLLGYDHIDDADARIMEGLECEILAKLGVANPYS